MRSLPVRILLAGEGNVGKTSLILSLVSEEFTGNVPPRAEEITIPPEVTPEKVATTIVDYSVRTSTEKELRNEVSLADVVCLIFSASDDDSFEKISTKWLPLLRKMRQSSSSQTTGGGGVTKKPFLSKSKLSHSQSNSADGAGAGPSSSPPSTFLPVVLVANKIDVSSVSTDDLDLMMRPLMEKYSEIETSVQCSAKYLRNVSELFYFAQKAVLYPLFPIYQHENNNLKSQCVRCLMRIFKIIDLNNDSLLDDHEILHFQAVCFPQTKEDRFSPEMLPDIKSIISQFNPKGIRDDKVTFDGFCALNLLYIQKGRQETVWTILRKFGYDNHLHVRRDYLHPPIHVEEGCSAELSQAAVHFLLDLFHKHDLDDDEILRPEELSNLFSTCPLMPWGAGDINDNLVDTVETDTRGWITKQGYLSRWMLMTTYDVRKTLETLGYLGFNFEHASQLAAVNVARNRRLDLERRQCTRNVLISHVVGPRSIGKSTFIQGLIRRQWGRQTTNNQNIDDNTGGGHNSTGAASAAYSSHSLNHSHPGTSRLACNLLRIYGQEKYLVLREIDSVLLDSMRPQDLECDVVCLLYDQSDPHSFHQCANNFLKHFYHTRLPVMIVATRCDLPEVEQEYSCSAEEFCNTHRLHPPQRFSITDLATPHQAEIYRKITALGAFPYYQGKLPIQKREPMWIVSWRSGRGSSSVNTNVMLSIGIGGLALAGLSTLVYKRLAIG